MFELLTDLNGTHSSNSTFTVYYQSSNWISIIDGFPVCARPLNWHILSLDCQKTSTKPLLLADIHLREASHRNELIYLILFLFLFSSGIFEEVIWRRFCTGLLKKGREILQQCFWSIDTHQRICCAHRMSKLSQFKWCKRLSLKL